MASYRTFSLRQRFGAVVEKCALGVFLWLYERVDRRPLLQRVLAFGERVRPIWRIGDTVLVTQDRQVAEVLRRDDDFPLPADRAEKFLTGAFILGMTRTSQHVRERTELRHVLDLEDRDRVFRLARQESERRVDAARGAGRLDVVEDLASPVARVLIQDYFGVALGSGSIFNDLKLLGTYVISPHSLKKAFRRNAGFAADRVAHHVGRQIGDLRDEVRSWSHLPEHATVLQRLIYRAQNGLSTFDSEDIRRNISGLLLPECGVTLRAFPMGLVQLLKKPILRAEAQQAVEDGNVTHLEGCVLEALRFHAAFPVLTRFCPRETHVSAFQGKYRVGACKSVYVHVGSAMFDPYAELFADGRQPPDASVRRKEAYRLFGEGAHACLGQHIALAQMAAMLWALLPLNKLKLRRIVYDSEGGVTPSSLPATFTAS